MGYASGASLAKAMAHKLKGSKKPPVLPPAGHQELPKLLSTSISASLLLPKTKVSKGIQSNEGSSNVRLHLRDNQATLRWAIFI
jgi:hypothetical protein